MERLKQNRFGIWLASMIVVVIGVLTHLFVPAQAASYGLLLLVVAYLLAWMGIFFHTDNARAQHGGSHSESHTTIAHGA